MSSVYKFIKTMTYKLFFTISKDWNIDSTLQSHARYHFVSKIHGVFSVHTPDAVVISNRSYTYPFVHSFYPAPPWVVYFLEGLLVYLDLEDVKKENKMGTKSCLNGKTFKMGLKWAPGLLVQISVLLLIEIQHKNYFIIMFWPPEPLRWVRKSKYFLGNWDFVTF